MPEVLVVGANLLFASKILQASRALGIEAESVSPDAPSLAEARLVFADVEKLDEADLRSIRAQARGKVIGFGSHVAEEALARARAVGCDEVLTRGQLAARLPGLLGG